MIDIIIFLENNGKSALYIGENIQVLYHYPEMIGAPTTLTTLGQRSHNFGPLSSINNDTAYLYPVIESIRMRQKTIFEWCRRIGNKVDSCR